MYHVDLEYMLTEVVMHRKDENTWGQQVIETALQYANHQWVATEENVLHGHEIYRKAAF